MSPFLTCDSYEFILGTGTEILEGDMGSDRILQLACQNVDDGSFGYFSVTLFSLPLILSSGRSFS